MHIVPPHGIENFDSEKLSSPLCITQRRGGFSQENEEFLKKVQDGYLCFQAMPAPQLCPLALCYIFKYIIFLPGSPRLGSTPNFTERQSPQQCRRFYRKAEQHPACLCLVI